jgi:mRNA interferase MazF
MVMQKGEVWWAELPIPVGRRPVLLLSRDEAYAVRNAVTVAEITTTIRNIPVEVLLDLKDGMPQKCVVNLDTLATIRKDLLKTRITVLKEEKMNQVNAAVKFALALT